MVSTYHCRSPPRCPEDRSLSRVFSPRFGPETDGGACPTPPLAAMCGPSVLACCVCNTSRLHPKLSPNLALALEVALTPTLTLAPTNASHNPNPNPKLATNQGAHVMTAKRLPRSRKLGLLRSLQTPTRRCVRPNASHRPHAARVSGQPSVGPSVRSGHASGVASGVALGQA